MTTNANSTFVDANDPPVLGANPLVGLSRPQIAAALARLLQDVAVEPGAAAASALATTGDLIETAVGRGDVAPGGGDKRFAHPAWSANPVYRRLMQAHLIEAKAVLDLVDEVDLDAESRERARFAVSLFTEAAAPTNTLVGNPSALAKAVETHGRSLVSGLRHIVSHIRRDGGMPATVDPRPFRGRQHRRHPRPGCAPQRGVRVDPAHAARPDDVYPAAGLHPSTDQQVLHIRHRARAQPDRAHGQRRRAVLRVSWLNPTAAQRDWNLDTYVAACKEAIEVACEITGSPDANLVGMCAGAITMA